MAFFKVAQRGFDDARRRRVHLRLERGRGRVGDEPGGDPLDGRGQLAEQLVLQDRGDLGPGPGELHRVVHDYGSSGTASGFDDRLHVERDQGAQIDDLGADALLGQGGRRRERVVHAASVADQADVGARPLDVGLAQGN